LPTNPDAINNNVNNNSPLIAGDNQLQVPPREDLRVFIRLEAESPARTHKDYAIWTHISRKLGVDPRKILRVLQVRSGWAVLTADITTRDLLVQRQTEWATDLGAAAIETRQEWFTYLVSDYPCNLTDLLLKQKWVGCVVVSSKSHVSERSTSPYIVSTS
jgi:hypothetical protein